MFKLTIEIHYLGTNPMEAQIEIIQKLAELPNVLSATPKTTELIKSNA